MANTNTCMHISNGSWQAKPVRLRSHTVCACQSREPECCTTHTHVISSLKLHTRTTNLTLQLARCALPSLQETRWTPPQIQHIRTYAASASMVPVAPSPLMLTSSRHRAVSPSSAVACRAASLRSMPSSLWHRLCTHPPPARTHHVFTATAEGERPRRWPVFVW